MRRWFLFWGLTFNVIARRHDKAIQNKSFPKLIFWIASFLAMTQSESTMDCFASLAVAHSAYGSKARQMAALYASLCAGFPLRVIARRHDEAIQGIKLIL